MQPINFSSYDSLSSSDSDDEQVVIELRDIDYKSKYKMDIYIDSEFTNSESLSLQAMVKFKVNDQDINFTFMVINKQYQAYFPPELLAQYPGVMFFFFDFAEDTKQNILLSYISKILKEDFGLVLSLFERVTCYLWFYFSAMDLNIGFGPDNMRDVYLGKHSTLKQKRSFSGTLNFKPFCACVGRTSCA
jgi:hypothetical protein